MTRGHNGNTRFVENWGGHFGTLLRRIATQGWIISAALLAIPCVAQLPPGVLYSTTVPGSGMQLTTGFAAYPNYPDPNVTLVATDASGNSYVAGAVAWSGLPTTPGVVQPDYPGGTCGFGAGFSGACPGTFVAKFDSSGVLVFLTYLGVAGTTLPYGLAVDAAGDIYVGGLADSVDNLFPSNTNTFVTKLSGNGKTLVWTQTGSGTSLQLATAPDGSAYYTTTTANGTATLTKLSDSGQLLATVDLPSGGGPLAVGADGSVYISGYSSGVTATPGAWQTTGFPSFVAKMNSALSGFAWLTFVPGGVRLLQAAPDGTVWASGITTASDFPVLPGALQSQPTPGGNSSGYLLRLSSDGSKALAATYLAAPVTSLASDASGDLIFGALGQSAFQATPGSEYPCPQPVQGDPQALNEGYLAFFGKIDSAGQHLLWGTWTGPSIPIGPVAADTNGNAIAAGELPVQEGITLTAMTTVPGSPRLLESCIAQSASPYASGPLAPGEIISIYSAGFGPEQGVGAEPSGNKFGTELAGVQVLIENTPVPLLYVSSEQINLVAPYLLNGRIAAHIKIVTADATSNEVILGVQPAAPEIFADPNGDAAILNQDGTVNSQNNPARIGDYVAMFVSGVGQTTPPRVDGEVAQSAGGTPVLPIKVQVYTAGGGPYANVTYAGNAPGLVCGVTQVNFQMPSVPLVGAGPPYQAQIILYVGTNSTDAAAPVIWFQ
jgi:uncharacterized protein (TIGR03437 family)